MHFIKYTSLYSMHYILYITILCFILTETYKLEDERLDIYPTINKSLFNYVFAERKRVPLVTNKLVCFYVFTKMFSPQIMEGLCTHISVGFFGINKMNNTLKISDEQMKMLSQIILLKKKVENLKIIISVGGAEEMGFSTMATNHTTRKMFIKSCMNIIKIFKIDGLDLDWEWPVVDSGNFKEKIKFVQLLHEIRSEFNRHKKKYILSIDVPSIQAVIELGYYVKHIANPVFGCLTIQIKGISCQRSSRLIPQKWL